MANNIIKEYPNQLGALEKRLLGIAAVLALGATGIFFSGASAFAGTTVYASWVGKYQDSNIVSGKSALKGGEVNLHLDLAGYVNATSHGQLRTGAGSHQAVHLNFTGGRNQWGGGSQPNAVNSAHNIAWWSYPSDLSGLGPIPISGRTVW